jgi:hypothetical protein
MLIDGKVAYRKILTYFATGLALMVLLYDADTKITRAFVNLRAFHHGHFPVCDRLMAEPGGRKYSSTC